MSLNSNAGAMTMEITNLIGASVKFRDVLDKVTMVGPVDSSVLLQGETGTGKEVIAQAIHAVSPRRQQPLVAINCAAIPAALLESEERGAREFEVYDVAQHLPCIKSQRAIAIVISAADTDLG